MKPVLRSVAAVAAILTVMSGCASTEASTVDLTAGPSAGDVLVRAGDQIELNVYLEPEMSGTYTVGVNGEVFLPKLGPIPVADLPISVVEQSLRDGYSQFLKNPSVNLTVLRRVGIHGEVRSPNLYLVDATVTLRDVIAKAGGLTDQGDPRKVTLLRDGEEIVLPEYTRGLIGADLQSGDQIVVGRRNWFERNSLALATSVPAFVLTLLTVLDQFRE